MSSDAFFIRIFWDAKPKTKRRLDRKNQKRRERKEKIPVNHIRLSTAIRSDDSRKLVVKWPDFVCASI